MLKIIHLLQKHTSGKLVIALFVVTQIVYLSMLFYSIPLLASYVPDKDIFDLSPTGYSYQQALTLLQGLGTEGRSIYLTIQLPLDTLYPGLFAVSYALLLSWILSGLVNFQARAYYLTLLPLAAGLFDYIENIFIFSMIHSFPEISTSTVKLASIFTILKSAFSGFYFIVLIVCLILISVKKIRIR